MRKHAYLIIASNEGETLKYLIRLLDDVRNDIFIHMDKKHGKLPYEEFKGLTKKSNLTFLKNRLNVKWGGVLPNRV